MLNRFRYIDFRCEILKMQQFIYLLNYSQIYHYNFIKRKYENLVRMLYVEVLTG